MIMYMETAFINDIKTIFWFIIFEQLEDQGSLKISIQIKISHWQNFETSLISSLNTKLKKISTDGHGNLNGECDCVRVNKSIILLFLNEN